MKTLMSLLLIVFAPCVFADWQLNQQFSKLNFISTKNSSVTEVHSFGKMAGSLSAEGRANLVIELGSVETGVTIRNERMKELLFQTERYPEAQVELEFDKNRLASLKAGQMMDMPINANLKLHGISRPVEGKFRVIKLFNKQIVVTTIEPLILNTDWFDLQEGIEKLREIVNLQSITATVPVTLNLVFDWKS